ncbi:MAG: D-alanine--D-alanine ligase [Deltaproteobacteria bacterium]|nr:D-alanine--D-alanine ligase [Deltaproteobacteria bacterium]
MLRFRRVAVLMGGWGEEREVSMRTGEAVAKALSRRGHDVHRVLAGPGLDRSLRQLAVDAAFLALHGRMGEDGKVQGLLEVLGVPYTGSGVMASALAMSKPMAKKILRFHNIPTPASYTVTPRGLEQAEEIHGDMGFPAVVKPASSGSSCGLSVVREPAELVPAMREALRFGAEALVERFIRGREITVGVLGDRVLGSCEIVPPREVFDYQGKYQGGSRYHLPARVSPTRLCNLESLALAAHRALGCRGYSRIDLIASDEVNDFVLEVNTLPGMTHTSLLPKIAKAAGLSFDELVGAILENASVEDQRILEPSRDTAASVRAVSRAAAS